MKETFTLRRFVPEDAEAVRDIIHRGLREINGRDYPAQHIEECCRRFTVEKIIAQAAAAHMYVAAAASGRILGTGTIAPVRGSETESILLTIFVLPEAIGRGIGSAIIRALENDEYFRRAKRIEIPSSITAIGFYRKMGYSPKNGTAPDEEGLVRMEKFH